MESVTEKLSGRVQPKVKQNVDHKSFCAALLHIIFLIIFYTFFFSLVLCLSSSSVLAGCTLSSLKITTHLKNLLTYASFNQIKSKHEAKLPTLCSEY